MNSTPELTTMLPQFVEDDSDLPGPLNKASKQRKRAKELAAAHLGKPANKVESPDVQGYFSRTQIVHMVGGESIVIQFRIQPLEIECFKKARELFGDVVPDVTQLHDEELEALGLSIYAMTYIPGQCWLHVPNSGRVQIAKSLGGILGHGPMEEENGSADIVDNYILPSLERLRKSITETTKILLPHVDRLIAAAPRLKKLPLYYSHHDLNETNVLIGNDNTVTGIVDWECAKALPFGMGLHRVTDTIVAQNSQGAIEIPEGSREAEEAFWDAVLGKAPPVVLENLELVQDALHIGSLTFAFEEKHLEGPDPSVGFLGGILTYRLPQLRGSSGPFARQYMAQ